MLPIHVVRIFLPLLRLSVLRLSMLLLALLPLAAISTHAGTLYAKPPDQSIQEIVIRGHDFAFTGPDRVEAGLLKITLENHGNEAHQANLGRLPAGKTLDDFFAAFQKNELEGLAMLEFVGGPNAIEAHARQETIVDLQPGIYVWICFVPSPDGVRHAVKEMMKPLIVAATRPGQPNEPKADLDVTLKDFTLDLPSEIKAGTTTWKVTNAGPEPHEITLVKLAEGKSAEDLVAYLHAPAGAPPFTFAGGIGGMSAGQTAWVTMALTPGEYVAFCPIPSFAHEGKSHHDLGMLTSIRVKRATDVIGSAQRYPWLVGALGLLAVGATSVVVWRDRRKSNHDSSGN